MDSCLAWSYSKGGSLPENCNQSAQSHALSLVLIHLNCPSLLSSSVQQGSFWQCSFCSVSLFATCSRSADASNHLHFGWEVSAGQRLHLSTSPCEACVCKDSGHCTVPWSLPGPRVHHGVTLVTLCSLEKETHECLGLYASLKICSSA